MAFQIPPDPLPGLAAQGYPMTAAPLGASPIPPPMPPMPPRPPMPQMDMMGAIGDQSFLDEMDMTMGLGSADGASSSPGLSPSGLPIQLAGEDLRTFMFRFQAMVENSITNMGTIHRDAARDRSVYKMMPRDQEYDGQPNLVSPVTANKTDGVIGHLRDAIEQRPIAAFSVEGVGKPAEEASEVAPLLEAYLERELNLSGSREVVTSEAPREACVTGVSLVVLSMTTHQTGEPFVQMELIPIEDVFIDDLSAKSIEEVGFSYRKRYRMYELQDMADAGYLDKEAVEKMRKQLADRERPTGEEKDKNFNPDLGLQREMSSRTVYTGYMRFKPEGEPDAKLYQCIYHRSSRVPLALRESPYQDAFDGPNADFVRVGRMSDSILGRGIPRRLAAVQEMADNAINNHLAVNNLAANPPYQYRANSPFGRFIEQNGRFGLRGGIGIPTAGPPDQGDVAPLKFENNGLNMNDVSVANQFASQATYTEEAIGSQSAGRKTLGQFQVEVHKGTIRLRMDLADFSYDMSRVLTKYYAMMCAYKIKPQGIVEIEPGGKLLGVKDIDAKEVQQAVMESLMPMLMSQEIQPQEFGDVDAEISGMFTNGRIPSAIRPDMTISLSGTKIIADKIAELEMLMQFGSFVMTPGLMDVLAQSRYVNYHVRSIANTMGFKDTDKRIPPPPNGEMPQPQLDQALGPYQEARARMSTV